MPTTTVDDNFRNCSIVKNNVDREVSLTARRSPRWSIALLELFRYRTMSSWSLELRLRSEQYADFESLRTRIRG